MHRPNQLVSTASLEWTDHTRKDRLLFRRKALGRASGGKQLGTSLYEATRTLPPPRHKF